MILRCKVGLPEAFWEFCLFLTRHLQRLYPSAFLQQVLGQKLELLRLQKTPKTYISQHYAKIPRFTHQTGVTNSSYFNQTKLSVSTIKHNRHLSCRKRWNDKKKKKNKNKTSQWSKIQTRNIICLCVYLFVRSTLPRQLGVWWPNFAHRYNIGP